MPALVGPVARTLCVTANGIAPCPSPRTDLPHSPLSRVGVVGMRAPTHRRRRRPCACRAGSGRIQWVRRSRDRRAQSQASSRPPRWASRVRSVKGRCRRLPRGQGLPITGQKCDAGSVGRREPVAGGEVDRLLTRESIGRWHPRPPRHRPRLDAAGVSGKGLLDRPHGRAIESSAPIPAES